MLSTRISCSPTHSDQTRARKNWDVTPRSSFEMQARRSERLANKSALPPQAQQIESADEKNEAMPPKTLEERYQKFYDTGEGESGRSLFAASQVFKHAEAEFGVDGAPGYYRFVLNKMTSQRTPSPEPDSLQQVLAKLSEELSEPEWTKSARLDSISDRLSLGPTSETSELYLGRYNGHRLGFALDALALDECERSNKLMSILPDLQMWYRGKFMGLRMVDKKDPRCIFVLGSVYASKQDNYWWPTGYVLAMLGPGKKQLALVWECYDLELMPPQFCKGPLAFGLAVFGPETGLHLESDMGDEVAELELTVLSEKPVLLGANEYDESAELEDEDEDED